jgi:hypothetical protein
VRLASKLKCVEAGKYPGCFKCWHAFKHWRITACYGSDIMKRKRLDYGPCRNTYCEVAKKPLNCLKAKD